MAGICNLPVVQKRPTPVAKHFPLTPSALSLPRSRPDPRPPLTSRYAAQFPLSYSAGWLGIDRASAISGSFKEYFIECCREAPHAWRKAAIMTTIVVNLVMLGLILLGWHLDAYPTAYFLVATGLLAALQVLIIFPFKLWKAQRNEIEALKGRHVGARKELWQLREEGVRLRNEGKITRVVPTWTKKFDDWHAQVLEQAAILSMDLRHALDPVDKIAAESNEQIAVVDASHQKNARTVAVLSTIPERRGRLAGAGGGRPSGILN